MKTIVIDDDDSERSVDGDHVNSLTKSLKQTPPTGSAKEVYPSFLNEFSTKVSISGCQLSGQEANRRAVDACQLPTGRTTKVKTRQPELSMQAQNGERNFQVEPSLSEHFLPKNSHRKRVQFQSKHHISDSHGPIRLTRDTSSSSSTLDGSSKVNKGEPSLPAYSFMEYENAPAVVYTKSESEANGLVENLKGPLGFDLEWRVMWHPSAQARRVALVQLCDHHIILLIQVSSMKRFPKRVLEVIESANIIKIGANILNDGEKLYRDFGIRAKGLLELGTFAGKADDKFSSVYNREIVSLAKMVAMYLDRTLLKGDIRTSNWEADLSRSMVDYAANDCHCALMVYDRLQEIAERDDKTLDVSTYTRQVNARPLKLNPPSFATPPQIGGGPTRSSIPHYCIPEPPRPQQLRAYKLWHLDKMPLDQMCMKLRTGGRVEPLKESTVISYVVGALQADPRLPFNMDDLKVLVRLEASSWQRHRQWITSRE